MQPTSSSFTKRKRRSSSSSLPWPTTCCGEYPARDEEVRVQEGWKPAPGQSHRDLLHRAGQHDYRRSRRHGHRGRDPEEVWQQTAELSGISKELFDSYYAGKEKAIAYRLGEVRKYESPKRLADVGVTSAPQSFVYLPS